MRSPTEPSVVSETLEVAQELLDELGQGETPDSAVLRDCSGEGLDAIFGSDEQFGLFAGLFALRMSCIPYEPAEVEGLTLRQFCELYARDSYPELPTVPLRPDEYVLRPRRNPDRTTFEPLDFRICFVLGCGRSGTTLFRAMLNVNDQLWAPGELHFATYDTLGQRAEGVKPILRHMFAPEAAERFGEEPAEFWPRIEKWEDADLPTTEAYRCLYDADPDRLIVDKCPPYSQWGGDLDWIAHHFPNARFIHIIRNPHDVIRSLVRMQLYKGSADLFDEDINPYHVAEILWVRHNENIAAMLADVEKSRKLLVRFEDLTKDPEVWLTRVTELLEVNYDPRMTDPYANADGPVAAGAGDPGVNLLSKVEHRSPGRPFYPTGAVCTQMAKTYGY